MHHQPALADDLSAEDRVDELCDAFEASWLGGERPRIGDFLAEADAKSRDALFSELLLVELEYRLNRGERPSRTEYLASFPQHASLIEAIDFKNGRSAFASTPAANDDTVRIVQHVPGARVAHFVLQERLGSGAAGDVWKAWDTRLERAIALKLPRALQLAEADLHRFLREARAAAQLRHPRLASVHEAGRDGDTVYIAADYVPGQSLRQYLTQHRLSHHAIAELCAEVAEALHHAHEHGVVHRDLKPANIIIDPDGNPHVIDFGLAKLATDARDLTLQGELLGTPAYMSPEQARGDAERVDRRTDVYALGAILYELLTGRAPHTGDQAAVLRSIATREPALPRTWDRAIPKDLETICLKAIEKDEPRRYTSAQEMAADLRRFIRDEPILARPVSRLERSWRRIRSRPAVAVGILLAAVAVGAMAVAGSYAQKNRELLGYHRVILTTEPSGARIAIAPLNDAGQVLSDQVTRPRGVTPVHTELTPGDYFIEAVLPDGRFQQVFRHVPSDAKAVPLANHHQRWKLMDDQSIVLPTVKIPPKDVTDDMVFVPRERSAEDLSSKLLAENRSFYVDKDEFTVGQLRQLYKDVRWIYKDVRWDSSMNWQRGDDEAISISYDLAVLIAEKLGKRLPTSDEYDHLFEMLAAPLDDRSAGNGAGLLEINRLLSGVAEWTCSAIAEAGGAGRPIYGLESSRVIRGGTKESIYGHEDNQLDAVRAMSADAIIALPRYTHASGLGFRCVRSAHPRFIRIGE